MNDSQKARLKKIKFRLPEIIAGCSVVIGIASLVYIYKDVNSNDVTLFTTRSDLAKVQLGLGTILFETDLGNFILKPTKI